jgi:hypothetical protein
VESILQALERSAEVAGSQASSLPGVNSLCKGFRNGELVVLSGPTGTDVYVCCCFVATHHSCKAVLDTQMWTVCSSNW